MRLDGALHQIGGRRLQCTGGRQQRVWWFDQTGSLLDDPATEPDDPLAVTPGE